MNPLDQFVLSNLALIRLLNIAIGSCLVCGIGFLFIFVGRRLSAPFRHGILVSAMLLALCCPLLVLVAERSEFALWRVEFDRPRLAETTGQPYDAYQHNSATSPDSEEANQYSTQTRLPLQAITWVHAAALAVYVWGVGIFVKVVPLLRGIRVLRRFRRSLVPATDLRLQRAWHVARQRFGRTATCQVSCSELAPAPMCFGVLRPRVVMPNGIQDELNDEQLAAVLRHEVAHLVRRDHWLGLVQRSAAAIYWWNPLLLATNSMIDELREQICDDIVVETSPDPVSYAHALADLAERVGEHHGVAPATGFLPFKGSHLQGRIARLLNSDRMAVTSLNKWAFISVCALALLMSLVVVFASVDPRSNRDYLLSARMLTDPILRELHWRLFEGSEVVRKAMPFRFTSIPGTSQASLDYRYQILKPGNEQEQMTAEDRTALEEIGQGKEEVVRSGSSWHGFRYYCVVRAQRSCLACHYHSRSQKDDVIGVVSISFSESDTQ